MNDDKISRPDLVASDEPRVEWLGGDFFVRKPEGSKYFAPVRGDDGESGAPMSQQDAANEAKRRNDVLDKITAKPEPRELGPWGILPGPPRPGGLG